MSNTNMNPAPYGVPYPGVPDVLPEEKDEMSVSSQPAETSAPQKKNVVYRVFAALLAAISVAVVFLLPVFVLSGGKIESDWTLFEAIKEAFKSGNTNKLFGILPSLVATTGMVDKIAAISFYAVLLMLALTVVLGVVTVFTSKKAPGLFCVVCYCFTAAWMINAIVVFAYASYNDYALKLMEKLDLYSLALAAVGAIIYFAVAIARTGKKALGNTVQFLLSAVAMGAMLLSLVGYTEYLSAGVETLAKNLFNIVVIVLVAVIVLNLVLAAIRVRTVKGLTFDLVRFIIQFVLGAALCYLAIVGKVDGKASTTFLIFAIVAAAVSLVQIVICAIMLKCAKNKNKAETTDEEETPVKVKKEKVKKEKAPKEKVVLPVAEEPAPQPAPEFVVEEFAEALPYDGGPVEGVAVAEEVNPTYVAPVQPVQTAGYDFYNSKSFDPFIAVLNNEERNQFTELFILKYKGIMPEIPDYQVGGDNKEFFRKLFIYLGQYRDKIPDGLLAKIYQFAIKM